jgi:HlyD family secretion protein
MKSRILLLISFVLLYGCDKKNDKADAYGNFEATEVIVSAETTGRILKFDAREGDDISKGQEIAVIDTVILNLQKAELRAAMNGIRTKITSINAQNDILYQQIDNFGLNISRIENMLKDDAATQKQHDDLTGQVAVLKKQIAANNTQKASVSAELSVYESKSATLNEQITRSHVKSPLDGTVIEKYAEEGEVASAGKPLAKIADLSIMRLKAYVSGAQLEEIKTGQEVTVRIDSGKMDYKSFNGIISYISGKAEFTPKIIQTKEERVSFVYAVTIDVNNDGSIKSGMPGELLF